MIVGVYSPAPQCGKSTVSNVLVVQGFTPLAFADPLKRMLKRLYEDLGYTDSDIHEMLYGNAKKRVVRGTNKTSRQIMDSLGASWGRNTVDPNLWVHAAQVLAANIVSEGRKVVFSDLRFPEEWEVCDYRIRVERPEVYLEAAKELDAEGKLEDKTLTIVNDGTVKDLEEKVQEWLNSLT